VADGGGTFGSGYAHTRAMLEGASDTVPLLHAVLKFMATWLTTWSGVPGGIFAPSLAIGGALGHDLSVLLHCPQAPTLMALGMASFLAAVTQAPLTSFIIVMEMVDAHQMVLSIMSSALVATAVARAISRPLYGELAALQLQRLPHIKDAAAQSRDDDEDASH
jgi:H+/Cl- antiporter ClcA